MGKTIITILLIINFCKVRAISFFMFGVISIVKQPRKTTGHTNTYMVSTSNQDRRFVDINIKRILQQWD